MGAFDDTYSTSVSDDVFGIVPNDSTTVSDGTTARPFVRMVYVTTGGTLKYTSRSGITNTIIVPSNFSLECAVAKVWATGTSAQGMLGHV